MQSVFGHNEGDYKRRVFFKRRCTIGKDKSPGWDPWAGKWWQDPEITATGTCHFCMPVIVVTVVLAVGFYCLIVVVLPEIHAVVPILNCCIMLIFYSALVESRIWVLDRRVFQTVMMKTGLQRQEENLKFLRRFVRGRRGHARIHVHGNTVYYVIVRLSMTAISYSILSCPIRHEMRRLISCLKFQTPFAAVSLAAFCICSKLMSGLVRYLRNLYADSPRLKGSLYVRTLSVNFKTHDCMCI